VLSLLARYFSLTLLLALGSSASVAAGKLFCCNDESGRQVCGDILPKECYGRAYREIGATGMTSRTVDAPLTAEERARQAAEEEQRKKDEIARKEQERQDRALLNTYANERDIEAMRTRAQNDVQKSIKAAEEKIVESRTRRKKFENEAEFYKKKTLPAEIQKGLSDADFDIKLQQSIIDAKQKELDVIREKYDEDTRRFLDLKRRGVTR
jgi:hypothetical protein